MRKRTQEEKKKLAKAVRIFRESLGLDLKAFSEKLGTDYSYVWRWEAGRRGVGYEMLAKMEKVFGRKPNIDIPEEVEEFKIKRHKIFWAETLQDVPKIKQEDFRFVPIVSGRIAAGQGAVVQDDIEDVALIHISQIGKGKNLLAVKIQEGKKGEHTGMSMWPILGPGDIVAIDKDDRTLKKGKIYAVKKKVGDQTECTLKYVEQSGEGILILVPENKIFPVETINLRDNPDPIIGRVIWCWRSLK